MSDLKMLAFGLLEKTFYKQEFQDLAYSPWQNPHPPPPYNLHISLLQTICWSSPPPFMYDGITLLELQLAGHSLRRTGKSLAHFMGIGYSWGGSVGL